MGLVAFLGDSISTITKKFKNAEGESLELKLEGAKDDILNSEVYQPHGFYGRPPKGVKNITIPVNGNRGHLITVAFHNYKLNISTNEGSAFIYSTNSEGDTIKGRMLIDTDGKMGMANDAENLKSLIDSLITAIIGLKTLTTSGPPIPAELDTATKAIFTAILSDFGDLLKDI